MGVFVLNSRLFKFYDVKGRGKKDGSGGLLFYF